MSKSRATLISASKAAVLCLGALFYMSGQILVAQTSAGVTPVSGETYGKVLDRLLPTHQDVARNTRFAITLRVLPPFGAESQVGISYALNSKCRVSITTLSKPLGMTTNESAARTREYDDVAQMASLVQAKTEDLEVAGDVARDWLKTLWRSIAMMSTSAPQIALKDDGTYEISVTLDATTYQVFYSDPEVYFEFSLPGPDPGWNGPLDKLNPLVRWMLSVRRQVESMRGQPGK